jgi:hypothetical protein
MHCFLPVRLIAVNIINVTALATSYLTDETKNFYAESITYYLTHSYFPYKFIAKLDNAPKAR